MRELKQLLCGGYETVAGASQKQHSSSSLLFLTGHPPPPTPSGRWSHSKFPTLGEQILYLGEPMVN